MGCLTMYWNRGSTNGRLRVGCCWRVIAEVDARFESDLAGCPVSVASRRVDGSAGSRQFR